MGYPKDKIEFLYTHKDNGVITFISKSAAAPVHSEQMLMFQSLVACKQDEVEVAKSTTRSISPRIHKYKVAFVHCPNGLVYERYDGHGYEGAVFMDYPGSLDDEPDYLPQLLLDNNARIRCCLVDPCSMYTKQEVEALASKVVHIIEQNYIHFPKNNQWLTGGGKKKFSEQVKYHIARNIPVEFTLPAFPVKSCNPDKTLGKLPDKAEELAIRSMKIIAEIVEAVYPPGVHYNIISDGHVFSDLVGSDDSTVDTYGEMFRAMAHDLHPGLITFYRLDDFLLQNRTSEEIEKIILNTNLEHPIKTELTAEAETARKVLMCLFGSDKSSVTKDIHEDPETRGLYRGFSRFMYEDLQEHPSCKVLPSKSARKKLCSRVGFLMIQRNRAYSTMVEWLFPVQIRVSIHPHPNRGPKFGVNVIHSSLVAAQRSSDEKNFHIPTPWHNAAVELADGKFMLVHSRVIQGRGNLSGEELAISEGLLKREGYALVPVTYPDGRLSHYKQIKTSQ